jgi:hypothetical protein
LPRSTAQLPPLPSSTLTSRLKSDRTSAEKSSRESHHAKSRESRHHHKHHRRHGHADISYNIYGLVRYIPIYTKPPLPPLGLDETVLCAKRWPTRPPSIRKPIAITYLPANLAASRHRHHRHKKPTDTSANSENVRLNSDLNSDSMRGSNQSVETRPPKARERPQSQFVPPRSLENEAHKRSTFSQSPSPTLKRDPSLASSNHANILNIKRLSTTTETTTTPEFINLDPESITKQLYKQQIANVLSNVNNLEFEAAKENKGIKFTSFNLIKLNSNSLINDSNLTNSHKLTSNHLSVDSSSTRSILLTGSESQNGQNANVNISKPVVNTGLEKEPKTENLIKQQKAHLVTLSTSSSSLSTTSLTDEMTSYPTNGNNQTETQAEKTLPRKLQQQQSLLIDLTTSSTDDSSMTVTDINIIETSPRNSTTGASLSVSPQPFIQTLSRQNRIIFSSNSNANNIVAGVSNEKDNTAMPHASVNQNQHQQNVSILKGIKFCIYKKYLNILYKKNIFLCKKYLDLYEKYFIC